MHEDILRHSRRLPQYGTLRLSGLDAKSFLQGQLSANVLELTADSVLLASCNSAQGRVQAVLWILERGDELVLITSTELVEMTAARLKKYVLRAKVKFEPSNLSVYGQPADAQSESAWAAPLAQRQQDDINAIRWPGNRLMLIAPTRDDAVDEQFAREWHLADIRAGVPMVHAQTHETFVAQMLNLDLLGGISFDKGCYTGQEIIARTHYRGSVKRRMFRYRFNGAAPVPGTRILAGEEPAGEVVTSEGGELLAVVQLTQLERELRMDGGQSALERTSVPYAVPITA